MHALTIDKILNTKHKHVDPYSFRFSSIYRITMTKPKKIDLGFVNPSELSFKN